MTAYQLLIHLKDSDRLSKTVKQTKNLAIKRPSHGKLKLANSCWQTQVGVCERHKNSRQVRFYLTPTVCKRVCHLFLCRSHTPTLVCQHEFANLSLSCEGRFRRENYNILSLMLSFILHRLAVHLISQLMMDVVNPKHVL